MIVKLDDVKECGKWLEYYTTPNVPSSVKYDHCDKWDVCRMLDEKGLYGYRLRHGILGIRLKLKRHESGNYNLVDVAINKHDLFD